MALPARAPRVLLVGAYERDNFGDLLFLLVTERYLEGADVVAAAPFSADMRHLLGREIPAPGGPDDELVVVDGVVARAGAAGLLTPHKLFRRDMLLAHGIRFPEGRRRLEDHRNRGSGTRRRPRHSLRVDEFRPGDRS